MPPRAGHPAVVRRRVVAIIQRRMTAAARAGRAYVPNREDLGLAFATAYAQAQDQGWVRPGSRALTAAGRDEEARRAADVRAAYKDAIYEWITVVARVSPREMARRAVGSKRRTA